MDVREDLEAAFAEAAGGEPIGDAAPREAAATLEAPAALEGAEGGEKDTAKPDGARERDATGKFAKPQDGAEPSETAKPADAEPPSETTRIPPSLPAAVKAKWASLEPEVKQAFTKLEETVQTSKAEWGKKAERLNRFDEILSPRREKHQLSGLDDYQAVQTLFAAQDLLERDPVLGLTHLARSYGVDLRQFAQQMSGPGQAQLPQAMDPALHPVLARVQTLENQLTQQSQAAEAAQVATATAEIEAFRNDPKNLYFDNVKDRLYAILQSGQAQTLSEAYETAIWASPEIRPLLLAEQKVSAQQAQTEAAQRERASSARRAAGSVTGAPGTASSPAAAASSGSVRDALQAAWEDHSA